MNDLIALLVVAAAFGATVLFHREEAKAWRAERADLLDRLVGKNYYAHAPTGVAEPERPQMTTDAAEAAYAHEQESIDRAWHEANAREHPKLYPDGIEAIA